MAMRYLGNTVDIHGGGLENIFPHHESEVAQSQCATGEQFVRFWLHNNMLTVNGQKMGKSLGNFTLLRDIFEKFSPMVVRLYILRSHYRSVLDFSDQGLESAASGLARLTAFRSRLGDPEDGAGEASEQTRKLVEDTRKAFMASMDDDLNTPGALAAVFDMVRAGNSILDENDIPGDRAAMAELLHELVTQVLGLDLSGGAAEPEVTERLCHVLAEARSILRKNRLFEEADRMRDRLDEMGFATRDLPEGASRITKK